MSGSGEEQRETIRPQFDRSIKIDFQRGQEHAASGQDELSPFCGQSGTLTHGSLGLQPPSHAPAILPRGRRSQMVDGMAHQAPNQGRSESRVSRSEVASSCGFCVSVAWILPRCVWVTTAVEKTVDRVTGGEVRSKKGKKGLVINVTTVLPLSGRVGLPTETFSGSAKVFRYPPCVLKRSKWQDRGIIQV